MKDKNKNKAFRNKSNSKYGDFGPLFLSLGSKKDSAI
jgi:hypothetical protein